MFVLAVTTMASVRWGEVRSEEELVWQEQKAAALD
jgi:hypothetical protein